MPLTALMYHEVVEPDAFDTIEGKINTTYVVSSEQFRAHLQALSEVGATSVSPADIKAWLDGNADLPERAVLITFDDGFVGNYTLALPLLSEYGFSATFFVVTNRIGDPMMLTWEQLREMRAAGMTIASHTASHPLLSTLDAAETDSEISVSCRRIEEQLGEGPRYLSLPNGDQNEWYRSVAGKHSVDLVFGSEFGRNLAGADPLALRRIAMKRSTAANQIRDFVEGRWSIFAANQAKQLVKRMLVSLLTKRRYDAIYNRLAGVEEQRKGTAR